MSTARSEKNSHETTKKTIFLTKRSSEGLKEFGLKKLLKYVEKSTKWRSKSIKNKKVIWKLTKTPVKKKQKQLEMNKELRTRKNFQKVKEMPPKWKQPMTFEKALNRLKYSFFQKKFFVIWKQSQIFWTKLWNQKQIGKVEKNPTIQTNSNFEICKNFGNKRWKMKKICQKQETIVEERKNF